jgi:hypothetical protein
MSRLVFIVLCTALLVNCDEPSGRENAREEKLRSALIDAFQSIKKASARGGIDEEGPLTADLIGSLSLPDLSRSEKSTTADPLDLFADDGLSFADEEVFGVTERKPSSTEKSHNVQHIVKTTKQAEKTTVNPNKDILSKLSDSIRVTLNDSKNVLKKESVNMTSPLGIENMLRVFDSEILVNQWQELQKLVAGECRRDVQEYVNGLVEKQLWALKSKWYQS